MFDPISVAVYVAIFVVVPWALEKLWNLIQDVEPGPNPSLQGVVVNVFPPRNGDNSAPSNSPALGNGVAYPRPDEVHKAYNMIQCSPAVRDPHIHFAISGVVKSGKSSLINSFRGLEDDSDGAADVGIVETTREITRYPDRNSRFVWYDIPGAGTRNFPSASYFNSQGLFAFDCIIILIKDSFQEHDAMLLRHCQAFDIPAYLVRSRSDQDIDAEYRRVKRAGGSLKDARKKYEDIARGNVSQNLRAFGFEDQPVYLINCDDILKVVTFKSPSDYLIDERNLLATVFLDCVGRRYKDRFESVTQIYNEAHQQFLAML